MKSILQENALELHGIAGALRFVRAGLDEGVAGEEDLTLGAAYVAGLVSERVERIASTLWSATDGPTRRGCENPSGSGVRPGRRVG
ncbi:MAG: hypothetical protein H0S85_07635 [Desulfovibrionaceae bacterium]|jgi:hypothetical protein|nr:hypothetical protein [Desulfovibrionaceae bacterium]